MAQIVEEPADDALLRLVFADAVQDEDPEWARSHPLRSFVQSIGSRSQLECTACAALSTFPEIRKG